MFRSATPKSGASGPRSSDTKARSASKTLTGALSESRNMVFAYAVRPQRIIYRLARSNQMTASIRSLRDSLRSTDGFARVLLEHGTLDGVRGRGGTISSLTATSSVGEKPGTFTVSQQTPGTGANKRRGLQTIRLGVHLHQSAALGQVVWCSVLKCFGSHRGLENLARAGQL